MDKNEIEKFKGDIWHDCEHEGWDGFLMPMKIPLHCLSSTGNMDEPGMVQYLIDEFGYMHLHDNRKPGEIEYHRIHIHAVWIHINKF